MKHLTVKMKKYLNWGEEGLRRGKTSLKVEQTALYM